MAGTTILANFYKCGDKTERPHYGVWHLIPLDKPDYHQPKYLGKIIYSQYLFSFLLPYIHCVLRTVNQEERCVGTSPLDLY